MQCMLTSFIKDKQGGKKKEFITDSRDDVVSQLPFLKKRFLTYKKFGEATFDQLFAPQELENSIKYSANNFKSSFLKNNGNGTFTDVTAKARVADEGGWSASAGWDTSATT